MSEDDLTYQIRGAIFDVYNSLGPGILESVYEEALVFELQQRGLKGNWKCQLDTKDRSSKHHFDLIYSSRI